jgi:hypothetical protein
MNNFFRKIYGSWILSIIFILLIGIALVKIPYSLIGVDAGAILPTARDIVKFGNIPYLDVFTIYSPLSYYAYGILYLFYEIPPMWSIMALNVIFLLLSSLIVFVNFKLEFQNKLNLSLFYFLICSQLIFDVKLEAIGLPLITYASVLVIKYYKISNTSSIVKLSILCAILFFIKQYYLILSVQIFLFLLIDQDKIMHRRILIIFLLTMTISFLLIFCILIRFEFRQIEINTLIAQFSGRYIMNDCASFKSANTMTGAVYSYLRYLVLILPFLIPIFIGCLYFINNKWKILILMIFSLNLALFLFNVNPHYIYISCPFLFLIFISFLENFELKKYKFLNLSTVAIIFLYLLRNHVYSDLVFFRNFKQNKEKVDIFYSNAARIRSNNEKPKNCYYTGEVSKIYNYYFNVNSMNKKKLGYIFLYDDCLIQAKKEFGADSIIIINKIK